MLFVGLLSLLIQGCAKQPPPPQLAVPPAVITTEHFLGSPLTGPVAAALPVNKAADAYALTVNLVALERVPGELTASLASQARIVVVTRSGLPVQASARMAQEGRFADGEDAVKFRAEVQAAMPAASFGRTAPMTSLRGALPVGVTARFDVSEPSDSPRFIAGRLVRRHVEVSLYRPKPTALQVAVVLEDLLSPPAPIIDTTPDNSTDADHAKRGRLDSFLSSIFPPRSHRPKESRPTTQPAAPPIPVQELVLFDRPALATHDSFALMLPFRFGETESRALAIFVDVTEGSGDASHAQVFAACLADLKAANARADTRPYLEPLDNPDWPGLHSALDAMAKPGAPRPAMVFLASQTGVSIFEDIAMVAEEDLRQALAAKVFARLGVSGQAQSKETLAWALESASYELLSEMSASAKLPGELMAVLTLHAGEAARHPGSLDDALRTSTNRSAFDLRLIAENYIYLEDSSPASRVRAYDWLLARNRAPAGYDPMGPAKGRRAALERALSPSPSPAQAAPAAVSSPVSAPAPGETR